jgi:hypothetical protein
MAESIAISIKKFAGKDYKRWSLEVEIVLEQKQVLGSGNGTEEVPDDAKELELSKMQHGIAQSTIHLPMERLLDPQHGIQKKVKALWDQLKEDYKSKGKLNVWTVRHDMLAVHSGSNGSGYGLQKRPSSVPEPSNNPTHRLLVGQTRTRTCQPAGFASFG